MPKGETGAGSRLHYETSKELHVSPFLPMDLRHRWSFSRPSREAGSRLAVEVDDFRGDERVFAATMSLERRPLDGPQCARALLRFPVMTAQVVLAIYWQALRLRLKGVPFHDHPTSKPGEEAA